MSLASLLAAVAVLLAFAGARELLAASGRAAALRSPARRRGRSAAAALKLGLPARLARAGLESRYPLPAVLMAKLAAAAAGASRRCGRPGGPGPDLPAGGDRACPRPASSSPTPCWSARRAAAGAACVPPSPTLSTCSRSSSTSGRSPAAGFDEIASARQGPLADELRVAVAELSCGRPLAAALDSLRERVPGSEIATLCASIERSRRLGSPLADQLRRQSDALRRDQRRAVEERAARAAPKIQLVVALVLVPSVLLMIAAGLIANAGSLLGGF